MTDFLVNKLLFLLLHVVGHVLCLYVPRLFWALAAVVEWRNATQHSQKITVVAAGPLVRRFFSLDAIDQTAYLAPPYNGHLSTVLCALRPFQSINYTRQVAEGADGNPICLDWLLADPACVPVKGILIIFPGLASWSQTNYVQHFVMHTHRSGLHCCVFNARGMGDTPLTQPRIMSAAWTGDIHSLSRTVLSKSALSLKFGSSDFKVWAVGFSLGGVILAKFLSEVGRHETKQHSIDAAFIINSPLDTLASSANITLKRNALYQRNITAGILRYARRHKDLVRKLPGIVNDDVTEDSPLFLNRIKTLYDFDKYINAPHNGFSSPEEYYAAVDTLASLRRCRIPVLCLISRDDPVTGTPSRKQLEDVASENKFVAFAELPYGGHLGYIGSPAHEWRQKPSAMEILVCNICTEMSRRLAE